MLTIGLIKETKQPADNRVAFTPAQCKWINQNLPIKIVVETSANRCFKDDEYRKQGIEMVTNLNDCHILMGIKEVAIDTLIPNKTYLFFSHTKKLQPYNKNLFKALIEKQITLIDYECLEHEDGQRMIGFGFFAGIVGAHNGLMAYGIRTQTFNLERVYKTKDYRQLINTYFGVKIPPIKIAVTGSGRVSHGIIEIMNLMDIQEVEPEEFIEQKFTYPVYVHLKGKDLYQHKITENYKRLDFHQNPQDYNCLFKKYLPFTDVLLNGVYWDTQVPRLFEMEDLKSNQFKISTIADITDDKHGSIPCNLGDQSIENPVYGVDRNTFNKTEPYLNHVVDVMAVGNLPNELPRDASRYFGEQLIKYILPDLIKGESNIIDKATILNEGKITKPFEYMKGFAK
ncbi:MAG: alanine dehydrogenase [Chitinophagaceae bacterium]|nr:alanine dehydrogenase [Chitinophagaceae bacterium]